MFVTLLMSFHKLKKNICNVDNRYCNYNIVIDRNIDVINNLDIKGNDNVENCDYV